jgi:hypothetical protein
MYGMFGLDALINAARYAHAFFHDVELRDIRETRRKIRPAIQLRKASGKPPKRRKR